MCPVFRTFRMCFIIGLVLGLCSLAPAGDGSDSIRPLQLSAETYDAGIHQPGDCIHFEIEVCNVTDQDVRLIYIFSECDCNFEMPFRGVVPAVSTWRIPVSFHVDEGRAGTIEERIFLLTDCPDQPKLSFQFVTQVKAGKGRT